MCYHMARDVKTGIHFKLTKQEDKFVYVHMVVDFFFFKVRTLSKVRSVCRCVCMCCVLTQFWVSYTTLISFSFLLSESL